MVVSGLFQWRRGSCRWRLSTSALVSVLVAVAASGCGDPPASVRNETVVLLPSLYAGDVGWCLGTLRDAEGGGTGCPATRAGFPIIAETLIGSSLPPEITGIDVTSGEVAAVSVDGSKPLPTRAETVLPDNLRAVVWEKPGQNLIRVKFQRPTPLGVDREAIIQTEHGITLSLGGGGLLQEAPSRNLSDPAHPPTEPCAIGTNTLSGLDVQGASVIGALRSYEGLVGEAFTTCAMTEYSLNNWPVYASLLVRATHPGATPPALPLLKPLRGHRGAFGGPGELGPEVARRVSGGWLVVAKGRSVGQRLALLEHLHATVHP